MIESKHELDEHKSKFADTLFTDKHFNELIAKGHLISDDWVTNLRERKAEYDQLIIELDHEISMQQAERNKHNDEQLNPRNKQHF
ncbi:TPA: hypothetical protein HA235_01515 [Candidatus Woesearchaeota archaeon]|nr:hypothetical protein [Candidatus Woesearchaeota archaeon]HIH31362.1 hypothetical protein [Candidatus Woesearchaeota archaeon]HIH54432.1 hypothetical protein [Candidatus Woesearchaeota archaeon]HIJ02369.1 hypothetical protein [Candidatus Woesearchaeota archaeon]HIJ14153.1 hypothetical protein [Candidatus Woesearchaeota archaeon]